MSRFLKISAAVLAAFSMWACVDNANMNRPANSNANTNANATAAKAPPTTDSLMTIEKQAQDAYLKGDGAFFENMLSDKFSMNMNGQKSDKAAAVKMISGVKCDVKTPASYDEQKMSMIDPDTAALVYKAAIDATCTSEGKTEKEPSPMRVATVFVRNGDKWQAIWHGETLIVPDPKTYKPQPMSSAPSNSSNSKSAANSNSSMNSNSNTMANTSTSSSGGNVDALAAVERSGWEAWKSHDNAKLQMVSTSGASFVDLFGNYSADQAETLKLWNGEGCTINSTNVSDTSGEMLSPTTGVLFFKATSDGTCNGMKTLPVWGTSFYVKEGDQWKMAFGFETPAA
jgi:hypothetical protein